MTASALLAGLIFGSIGFVAFIWGKKQSAWPPMVIGAVLMAYTYFVPDVIAQYVIGALLVAALYVFRNS